MLYLDAAVYFLELAAAMVLADAILRWHYMPREFGFYWWFTFSPLLCFLIVIHPWGLIIAGPICALLWLRRPADLA